MKDNDKSGVEPSASRQPSKPAKLAAVFVFFVILFVVADMIGLPLATEFVFSFFLMIAAPLALMGALLVVVLLALLRRGVGIQSRLFDAGLQTFIMVSLLVTGIFVVRMPGILQNAYPEWRDEVAGYMSADHTPEEKREFLEATDRLWFWFRDVLTGENETPGPTQQGAVRDLVLHFFSESLAPDCPTCEPVLTRAETRAFVRGVNEILPPAVPSASPQARPTEVPDVAPLPGTDSAPPNAVTE